jgi:hypothetical protein
MNTENITEKIKKHTVPISISIIGLILVYVVYKFFSSGKDCPVTQDMLVNQKKYYENKIASMTNPPNSILLYMIPGYISITASQPTLLKTDCNDTRKIVFKEAMRGGESWPDANDNTPVKPMCANIIFQSDFYVKFSETFPKFKYTKQETDWLFFSKEGQSLKMVWVCVLLKDNNIYAYVKEGRYVSNTSLSLNTVNKPMTDSDFSYPINIYNLYRDSVPPTGSTPLPSGGGMMRVSSSNQDPGYGIRNVSFMVYNSIRPLIADTGYGHLQRGWYDVSGKGEADHYCRSVGSGDHNETGIWVSCLTPSDPNDSTTYVYNKQNPNSTPLPNSNRGVYKTDLYNLPQSSNSIFYNANTIDLEKKFKLSPF